MKKTVAVALVTLMPVVMLVLVLLATILVVPSSPM